MRIAATLRSGVVIAIITLTAIASLVSPCLADHDLARVYPATRAWSQYGLTPITTADDVWIVTSYEITLNGALELRGDRSTVVFGRDGTGVLWAVILPDMPHPITGTLASEGEHARSILLRFAPSEIGRIFPAETVEQRGDPWLRYEARRIASRKMVWRWATPAGNPTIVPRPITIVDVDTIEGPRRFWVINRDANHAERIEDFTDRPTPPLQPIDRDEALSAFDEVWSAFDREYAKFVDLPHVNWNALREQYRAFAEDADTTFALGAIISEMLAHLEDLHIWVRAGDDWLPGYFRDRPLNANWEATRSHLAEQHTAGNDLLWGRTADGIGYLSIFRLFDQELPQHVDVALDALRNTKGMIIDLRFNGGGDELLARAVAGRFAAEPVIYSKNNYRNGPRHDDLSAAIDRVLEPRGPWRYDAPVICLQGRITFSSAESFAAMFAALPNVTTLGSPTGGSSANPRQLALDCGIVVNLPRWRDLLPDGAPIEGRGVPPQITVEHTPSDFTNERDPVFDAALAELRKRIAPAVE
jgi:hypothetical protein